MFPLDLLLKRLIRYGHLTVIDTDGRSYSYGDAEAEPRVTVRLTDPKAKRRLALNPELAVGEAYADGSIVIDKGTLREFLEIALISNEMAEPHGANGTVIRGLKEIYYRKQTVNRIGRAQENVHHHYDISHTLYEKFLDQDMQYSCAYFRNGTQSLEQAQLDKKRHLAKKLLLKPGMDVLDIGSGWGGLALHLAREHDVRVTGVTLSDDQYETSVKRAEEAGLSDRVTFKLLDYRLEPATFDRVVSVGMFEHVGRPRYHEFFQHIDRLLKPAGVAVLHTIGKMGAPGPINSWIRRYIFPGAYLPTISQLAPIIEQQGLLLTDLENLRLHYAKTLNAWNERFQDKRSEIAQMFDERFCRMWEFYLQSCEVSFVHQGLCVFQLQLAKKMDTVPITRDYIYADGVKGAQS